MQSIWALDFFPPAYVGPLLGSFDRLGLNSEATRIGEEPATWLRKLRDRPGDGWMNLGTLVPRGSKGYIFKPTRTDLPRGVQAASASLVSINSSLACVVVRFDFEGPVSESYDSVSRRVFATQIEPTGRGYSSLDAGALKAREIERLRELRTIEITSWFRAHFPGVFSSRQQLRKPLPFCELHFVTDRSPDPRGNGNQHRRFLGIDHTFDRWRSVDIEGLHFYLQDKRGPVEHPARFEIARTDLARAEMTMFGGHDDHAYRAMLDLNHISMLVSLLGLRDLLHLYQAEVNHLRDHAALSFKKGSDSVLRQLQSMGPNSYDIVHLGPALNSAMQFFEIPDFQFTPGYETDRSISLVSWLRETITESAATLRESEMQLREILVHRASVAASIEGIALQKTMRGLTIATTALALVSVMGLLLPTQLRDLGDIVVEMWKGIWGNKH